ncbi:agmatinase [Methanosarcinales archaeon]|nr:MAG: agmatinase [Methanosarcinales archaeon]
MYTEPLFAASRSAYADAKVVILGMPLEKSVSFRGGCRFAPDAIRTASRNLEWYSFRYDTDLADALICDMGDLDVNLPITDLKMLVNGAIEDILRDGKLPIVMGGEHTVSSFIVPATGVDTVIIFDAHPDLRDSYGGDEYAHACTSRRIVEAVGAENVAIIGVRSGSKEEFEYAKDEKILVHSSEDLSSQGPDKIIDDLKSWVGDDKIYISIDMDVLDPSFAPAVSNPEPYGISPFCIREFIHKFAGQTVGFDIVEITPTYDHGITAIMGAKFIIEFIHSYLSGDI